MIKIVESQKDFGAMNTGTIRWVNLTDDDKKMLVDMINKDRAEEGLSAITIEDLETYDFTNYRKKLFREHRLKMGEAMGFDGNHMFMADQDVAKSGRRGSHFELTREYVEAYPNGWTDIPEDILVVTDKVPGVVIGHPVADCPVVMMTDKKQGISTVGHCSAELIDCHMPRMIGEVLRSAYGSRAEDIYAYVSACAGPNWIYESFPKWANDGMKPYIYDDHGEFHIHMIPAVLHQLMEELGIPREHIIVNDDDTLTDDHYFSNAADFHSPNGRGTSPKFGRHYAGLFYEGDDQSDIVIQKGRGR